MLLAVCAVELGGMVGGAIAYVASEHLTEPRSRPHIAAINSSSPIGVDLSATWNLVKSLNSSFCTMAFLTIESKRTTFGGRPPLRCRIWAMMLRTVETGVDCEEAALSKRCAADSVT